MTELVEHGAHPAFVLADIEQDANIALMVHVQTKCVLALSFALVQVGAAEQIIDIQADAAVVGSSQGLDVRILEDLIQ